MVKLTIISMKKDSRLPKGFIGSSYNDILIDKLTYDVTTPGTYCIYSPLIDGYEYRVDVEESSIQFDNVVLCC